MMGQLSACKCWRSTGDSRVNAAKRTQVHLEKAISKCKLFCSQLGYVLSGQHQRDVGFY